MPADMMDEEMMTGGAVSGDIRIDARSLSADHYGMAMSDEVEKGEMVVGMMMNYAEDEYSGEFRPDDFMGQCPDAEAVVNEVMAALDARDLVSDRPFCTEWEQRAQTCIEEGTATCEEIREGQFPGMADQGMTCPPDHEQMVDYCIAQFEEHAGERQERMQEACRIQWEGRKEFCDEREKQLQERRETLEELDDSFNSSRDAFKEEYADEFGEEFDEENLTARFEGVYQYEYQIDGSGDDFTEMCNKETFMAQCETRNEEMQAEMRSEVRAECQQSGDRMVTEMQQMCGEREEAYNDCMDHHEQACSFATEAAETCTAISREELRDILLERAETMCEVHERMDGEDEYGEMLKQMREVRDGLDREKRAAIDEKEDEFLRAAKKLEEVEEREASRGIGYAAKRLLGMAAEQEQRDIEDLQESIEQLEETINSLESIAQQTSDVRTREAILTQVENLEDRRDELEEKVEEKRSRARGILSIFS